MPQEPSPTSRATDAPHAGRSVARAFRFAAGLILSGAVALMGSATPALAVDPACYGTAEDALPEGVAPVPAAERWGAHFIDGGQECDVEGPTHGGTSGADGNDAMDFDGDCDLDIVTGWEESGKVFVYLNPLLTTRPPGGCPGRYWSENAGVRTTDALGPDPMVAQWPALEITRQDTNDLDPFAGVEDSRFGDHNGDGVADYVVISTEIGRREIFVSVPTRSGPGWQWHTFKLTGEENYMRSFVADIDVDGCPDIVSGSKTTDSGGTGDIRWWQCRKPAPGVAGWEPHLWKAGTSSIPSNDDMRDMWGPDHKIAGNIYWIMELEPVNLISPADPNVKDHLEILFNDRKRIGYMQLPAGKSATSDSAWEMVVIDNPGDSDEPFRWHDYAQLVDSDGDGSYAMDDPGDPPEIVVAYDANYGRGVFARWYEWLAGGWGKREVIIDGGELPWDPIANKATGVADIDGDGKPEIIGTLRGHNYSGVFALRPEGGQVPRCFKDCTDSQEWVVSRMAPWYTEEQGEIKYDNMALIDADMDCDLDFVSVEENGIGGKGLGLVWYQNPLVQGPANTACLVGAPNTVPRITAPDTLTVAEYSMAGTGVTALDPDGERMRLVADRGTLTEVGQGVWSWSGAVGDGPSQVTVHLTATDRRGGTRTHAIAVNVLNVPPVISSVTNTGPRPEGSSATVSIVASDVGDNLTYGFDCNGDGLFESGTLATPSFTCGFADEGIHRVNVRVTDGADVVTGFTNVTVTNVIPAVQSVVLSPPAGPEGSLFDLRVEFADPGADVFACSVAYGDGSAAAPGTITAVAGQPGRYVCAGAPHLYADNGLYSATAAVSDGDSPPVPGSVQVSIANVAPAVEPVAVTPASADLLGPVSVQAEFSDPAGLADAPYACTVDFGDGGGPVAGTVSGTACLSASAHAYAEEGAYTITIAVTDKDTATTSAAGSVTVLNQPPSVAPPAAAPAPVSEGDVVQVAAMFSDGGDNGPYTCTVDYGDGSGPQAGAIAGSTCTGPAHLYLDNGAPTVTVAVADSGGFAGATSAVVPVANVPPALSATATSVVENQAATVSGSIADPGPVDTFTLEADWGDGTVETLALPAGTTSFSLTHLYPDDNPAGTASDVMTVWLRVTDDDGGAGDATSGLTVSNAMPTATFQSIVDEYGNRVGTVPPDDVEVLLENISFSIAATYEDAGPLDTHEATIDWGAGAEPAPLEPGTLAATHAYAEAGTHTIVVEITDDDTGSVTVSRQVEVVSAAGALDDVTDRLNSALAGPALDPLIADALRQALTDLEGQYDGVGVDGALDQLAAGDWMAFLVALEQAVAALQAAGWDAQASQLVLAAKSVVVGLVDAAAATATSPRQLLAIANARARIELSDETPVLLEKIGHLESALVALQGARSKPIVVKGAAGDGVVP